MRNKVIFPVLGMLYGCLLYLISLIFFTGIEVYLIIALVLIFLVFLILLILIKFRNFKYKIYGESTNSSFLLRRSVILKVILYGFSLTSLFFYYNLLALLFDYNRFHPDRFYPGILFIVIFSVSFFKNLKS